MSTLEERHGKLAQLHPEDLLDKVARGTLTEDERERLDAHLAQCSACRMEQLLRADFEADVGGDRISFSSLVEGALGAVANDPKVAPGAVAPPAAAKVAEREPPVVERERPSGDGVAPVVRVAPAPWKRFALLFAAAFVLLATAAAASEQGRSFARKATSMFTSADHTREKESSVEHPAVAPSPPKALEVAHAPDVPARVDAVPPSPVEAPVVAAVPPPARGPEVAASPVVRAAPVVSAEPVAVPAVAPVELPVAEPVRDAAALFSSANDLRRAGNTTGALAAYGELVARFPSSREAATAHALRGRMLLERHEARSALSEFDAYLAAGRGELREEAMVGRARAFGILGQAAAERTAWQTVLEAFPRSASADHARLRIEALAGR